ncbi:jg12439 [Pararge aegeria aegeria]|uniref:Jg12439 protein n=1 Tax=Pararge aegeria aegeria TaxID=348720 RepID=A0A8S4RRY6_9NEOP|nr:jg12439 [Pararge aegeria aegeria]
MRRDSGDRSVVRTSISLSVGRVRIPAPPFISSVSVSSNYHITCFNGEGKHREENLYDKPISVKSTNPHWASEVDYGLNPSHCERRPEDDET